MSELLYSWYLPQRWLISTNLPELWPWVSPNQLRERAISHHFWQTVALNVKFWQLVNLWLNSTSLPCIEAGYFEAIMLLFCTPCPNRSQVWRPRRGERWFVIYYGGDHRVLQVITAVIHCLTLYEGSDHTDFPSNSCDCSRQRYMVQGTSRG